MAPRGIPQQCSKCGKPFMGSDAITFPILCWECTRRQARADLELERQLKFGQPIASTDISGIDCGRKVGGLTQSHLNEDA